MLNSPFHWNSLSAMSEDEVIHKCSNAMSQLFAKNSKRHFKSHFGAFNIQWSFGSKSEPLMKTYFQITYLDENGLTLSRAGPSAVSIGRGRAHWALPLFGGVLGGCGFKF